MNYELQPPPAEYWDRKYTALFLNTTEARLRTGAWRGDKALPPVYKFGRRVLYKRSEVEACVKPASS